MRLTKNVLCSFFCNRRGEMDEAAIVFPVMLLLAIGLVNMALLGVAAVNAGNAANYGARMGAVAQVNPAGIAYASASQAVRAGRLGVDRARRTARPGADPHPFR